MDVVLYIILIKVCYVYRSGLIHGTELQQIHPAADVHHMRRIGHEGADAHGLAVRRLGDRAEPGAVLVFAGEKRNQVMKRKDAQLVQRERLFLPYALDIANITIQFSHGHSANLSV